MNHNSNMGIIDIGSNSIRLVIYEIEPGGCYRIIYENKYSARLSREVAPDGTIPRSHLDAAVNILNQFKMICRDFRTTHIRAAATAAIRNAANAEEIIGWLEADTGLVIERVSGEREAYYGFLGVLQSMDVQDGMIVDIGGGSTELTLFRNRKLLHSISIPLGAVNGLARFATEEQWDKSQIEALRAEIRQALEPLGWPQSNPGLPLIGLGGTIRTLAKIHQRQTKYSLPAVHHYEMEGKTVDGMAELLPSESSSFRKKLPGLSKDRADLIVPGLLILQTVFHTIQADRYIVSGAGLRDGLFRDWFAPKEPVVADALKTSVQNMLRFGPPAPEASLEATYKDMFKIYKALEHKEPDERDTAVMYTAAMLSDSGILINYYKSSQHAVYRIMYGGIYGLSHREALLSAITADYHPKKRTPQLLEQHADILKSSDTERVHRLGSLLILAKAIRSAPVVEDISVKTANGSLHVQMHCTAEPLVQNNRLEEACKDLEEAWKIKLTWSNLEVSKG
ncbi:Ppx/GppA phosphatase family protein [Paenibacillus physcomitrellae]|uniref:Exopolyphosphatase n=1 Tax=Paenibacillus physcomitrellae TaxID=1619311 RepID=A0ABQ1FRC7_9BACL|nr:Ppx/GppA phosphatase family protein [Paenibacillus physcomitrellae]GGA27816.1 exopolyphosphatase [Paenibacillus physcomitrellae]